MSVISENNKTLTIRNGEGISQAILKELKSELNKDNVKLNLSVWNKIFDVVKEDKEAVVKKCQYQGGDEDIRNNSNYVVQSGNYELTQSAWEKICNIAKNAMGIAVKETVITDQNKENPVVENEKENPAQDTKTPEEKVQTLLKKVGIDIENENDEFKKDVLSKFNTMLLFAKNNNQNLDDETIKTRLSNYVKALRFHNVELAANKGEDVVYENTDCANATTEEELIDKYHQFGKEYVELYDQDGDGSIDVYEMFYQEIIDHCTETLGYSQDKAKQTAITIIEEYQKKGYSMKNMPTGENMSEAEKDMALLFSEVVNKIRVIDTTSGATTDMKISESEAAAHLISTAQLADDKNAINKSEFNGGEIAIAYEGYTQEEIKNELNCDDNFAKRVLGYVNKYTESMKFFMPYFNK